MYKSSVPQREEKGDNKVSCYRSYRNQGCRGGRRMSTIKRTDTEAIEIKGVAEGEGG